MTTLSNGDRMKDATKEAARRTRRWVSAHAIPLLASGLVVLLIWTGWSVYDNLREKEIVFLTGPPSGSGLGDAQRIKAQLEDDDAIFGDSYSIQVAATTGYEENRKRIKDDADGNLVGFAYDGFGSAEDADDVAIVLPLDKRYLHILCRKDYLLDLKRKKNSFWSIVESWTFGAIKARGNTNRNGSSIVGNLTLAEIYQGLGRGRVYLGTRESATHQMAEVVLRHFGKDPEEMSCHGVTNFSEMRAALNTGHVDLAFSSGLFNTELIREIAQDGTTILLGLNEERDAIAQEHPQLIRVDFQPNSYVSGEFCEGTQETIGARRVIICSTKMSEKDAYLIGLGAMNAFHGRMPEVDWTTPPLNSEQTSPTPLRYSIHPGARLIRDNQLPSSSFNPLYLVGTGALWGVVELALLFFRGLFFGKRQEAAKPEEGAPGPPDPADPNPPDTERESLPTLEQQNSGESQSLSSKEDERILAVNPVYDALLKDINELLNDIGDAKIPLTTREHAAWRRKSEDVRARVLEANLANTLTLDQTHDLLVGINKELETEIEIRRPAKRKAGSGG